MIPSNNKPSKISSPRKSPLNFIAAIITPYLASIIIFLPLVIAPVRANQFNTFVSQTFTQSVTVIVPVGNQSPRFFSRSAAGFAWHSDIVQRFFEEHNFVQGRRVQVASQRNTFAVDHHHPICSLAAFGLSNALAPFFAGAKLPSANALLQSNCPRWLRKNARHASSQMSCSSQSLSLRQHVEALGNCFAKSAQGIPPRFVFLCFGSSDSIFSHCESANLHLCLAIEKTPFNGQVCISSCRAQV